MSLAISSHFQSKLDSTNPTSFVHLFLFNSLAFTNRVLEYSSVSRQVGEVIGGEFVVDLENATQDFNTLITNKENFLRDGGFEIGVSTESGTSETIKMFGGRLKDANFDETKVSLVFEDLLGKLKTRKIGTSKTPVSFTNTIVKASDLFWWVVTSYGGLSVLQSTNNPDIDYTSFLEWEAALDTDGLLLGAQFEGETVVEAIDLIARLTDSVIYGESDNKIYPNRFSAQASLDLFTLIDSAIIGINNMTVTADKIINQITVSISYNPTSRQFAGEVTHTETPSVNSFGIAEQVFDDTAIWHVSCASALNIGQRLGFRRAVPNTILKIKTPLTTLNAQLGDGIDLTTKIYSFSNHALSIIGYIKDIEAGIITLEADEGFGQFGDRLSGFLLDVTTFGVLDQTYNPLL